MKRRIVIGFVCWLYVSVALLTGLLWHDHAHGTACPHNDCAACALQINLVADVPVVIGDAVAVTVVPVELFLDWQLSRFLLRAARRPTPQPSSVVGFSKLTDRPEVPVIT